MLILNTLQTAPPPPMPPPPPGAPIDSGVLILFFVGLIVGLSMIYKARKASQR